MKGHGRTGSFAAMKGVVESAAALVMLAALALCACGGSSTAASRSPSAAGSPSEAAVSGSPAPAATLSWTRTAFDPGALEDHWEGVGVLRDGRVRVAFLNWRNWSGEASTSLRGAKLGPWASWTSDDGVSWTRSSRLPVAKSALISGVVRWRGGLVVAGTEGSRPTKTGAVAPGHPVTWTSREGVVWRRSPDQESLRYAGADRRNRGTDLGDLAAGGRYLIMAGNDLWEEAATRWHGSGLPRTD